MFCLFNHNVLNFFQYICLNCFSIFFSIYWHVPTHPSFSNPLEKALSPITLQIILVCIWSIYDIKSHHREAWSICRPFIVSHGADAGGAITSHTDSPRLRTEIANLWLNTANAMRRRGLVTTTWNHSYYSSRSSHNVYESCRTCFRIIFALLASLFSCLNECICYTVLNWFNIKYHAYFGEIIAVHWFISRAKKSRLTDA